MVVSLFMATAVMGDVGRDERCICPVYLSMVMSLFGCVREKVYLEFLSDGMSERYVLSICLCMGTVIFGFSVTCMSKKKMLRVVRRAMRLVVVFVMEITFSSLYGVAMSV